MRRNPLQVVFRISEIRRLVNPSEYQTCQLVRLKILEIQLF